MLSTGLPGSCLICLQAGMHFIPLQGPPQTLSHEQTTGSKGPKMPTAPPRRAEVPPMTVPTSALPFILGKQVIGEVHISWGCLARHHQLTHLRCPVQASPAHCSLHPAPGWERRADFTWAVGLPCSPERLPCLQRREMRKGSGTFKNIYVV